jgi:TolB protein
MSLFANRFARVVCIATALLAPAASALAQDTTFRGITLGGNYDPLHDKIGIVVLAVPGAFGDSVRAIVQRDLDFSDRFTIVTMDDSDPTALRGANGTGLNYQIFSRLRASAVVQITTVGSGLHVAMHDVSKAAVINVGEFPLASTGLGRDWRLGVHRASDEVERWVTGQRGISASRIAYMRGQQIHLVDSDGADEITVPTEENGVSPAWSPNGASLAYSTFGASSRLMLMDLSTGRSRPIVGPTRNTTFSTPEFMPDGNTVVYSRSTEDGSDLYSISTAGDNANPHRLTVGRGAVNSGPTISPDARRIVYVGNALGRPELYIMDSDGTGADVLTNYDFSEKNYRSDPDWSPDGRLIAYQEMINGHFQIRTIPARGGTPKLLTSEGENEQPSWAPDSRHVVFTSTRTGVRQLWVLDTETFRFRQLTKSSGSRLAAWSTRIAGQ